MLVTSKLLDEKASEMKREIMKFQDDWVDIHGYIKKEALALSPRFPVIHWETFESMCQAVGTGSLRREVLNALLFSERGDTVPPEKRYAIARELVKVFLRYYTKEELLGVLRRKVEGVTVNVIQ